MMDLFGTRVLPGLSTSGDLVTAEEEASLIAAIDATEELSPFRFQGWTGKRLTASYGWTYDFDTGRMKQAVPLPDWLLPFRDRAACFARLPAEALVQALLIRYGPGTGIGWHKDRPAFDHVIGLSLGAAAVMRLRRRRGTGFERAKLPLEPRGAYHLAGVARHEWEHSIAEMDQPRWSITFRSLAEP
ncbi:alpha-ketoglutarate-dependent dioxygenase AlkB [Roseomonas eburnea]|uniref:Alpha-ketoglutarate-dependent dioxygenase AlkB n=1 Tax=Neoroseomonas eburnea TaxID=1346889 RepID=A0A9X9XK44_9PROT|nr:alpha-ketoglutarate-dependent dioxygenase AlkB [Neoroseomonas eburnea]MBR0684080.1 alpha-ketoglutarate-dependent dioxygenase AlkB [Neoroseomonas eburnea]